jgi:hypothetical protein
LLSIALLSIALLCSWLTWLGKAGGARDVGTIRARLAHDGWHAATVSMAEVTAVHAEVTAVHASAILDVDRRGAPDGLVLTRCFLLPSPAREIS